MANVIEQGFENDMRNQVDSHERMRGIVRLVVASVLALLAAWCLAAAFPEPYGEIYGRTWEEGGRLYWSDRIDYFSPLVLPELARGLLVGFGVAALCLCLSALFRRHAAAGARIRSVAVLWAGLSLSFDAANACHLIKRLCWTHWELDVGGVFGQLMPPLVDVLLRLLMPMALVCALLAVFGAPRLLARGLPWALFGIAAAASLVQSAGCPWYGIAQIAASGAPLLLLLAKGDADGPRGGNRPETPDLALYPRSPSSRIIRRIKDFNAESYQYVEPNFEDFAGSLLQRHDQGDIGLSDLYGYYDDLIDAERRLAAAERKLGSDPYQIELAHSELYGLAKIAVWPSGMVGDVAAVVGNVIAEIEGPDTQEACSQQPNQSK